jgi:hypothetical protein
MGDYFKHYGLANLQPGFLGRDDLICCCMAKQELLYEEDWETGTGEEKSR